MPPISAGLDPEPLLTDSCRHFERPKSAIWTEQQQNLSIFSIFYISFYIIFLYQLQTDRGSMNISFVVGELSCFIITAATHTCCICTTCFCCSTFQFQMITNIRFCWMTDRLFEKTALREKFLKVLKSWNHETQHRNIFQKTKQTDQVGEVTDAVHSIPNSLTHLNMKFTIQQYVLCL